MARIRTIKPDFFRNEILAELPMPARVLFIGLWTLSDRRGRLEDRPKRIKADVFPYDSVDCEDLLQRLQSAGFIVRYTVEHAGFGEMKVIQVCNFEKHQRIQGSEAETESIFPAPNLGGITKETPKNQQGITKETPKNTGKEGKGIGKEMERNGDSTPANFDLIFEELTNSVTWQQGIAIQQGITGAVVREKLEFFLRELQLKDDYHKGLKEIKSHFINWLKIEISKEKNTQKKENGKDENTRVATAINNLNSILRKPNL